MDDREPLFQYADSEPLEDFAADFRASRSRSGFREFEENLVFASDGGRDRDVAVADDSQFVVFQFTKKTGDRTIMDTWRVEPDVDGSEREPDARVQLSLLSFHAGEETKEKDARATMRITMGEDSTASRVADVATWAVAAGLKLYDEESSKVAQPAQLSGNLNSAFRGRSIEIRGGMSRLSFEVVRHVEPPWWRNAFRFLTGSGGRTLVSMLGFPGITIEAVRLVDQLLNRLSDVKPDVIFRSRPMQLALTKYARDTFRAGNERIRVGSLARGFCVLARRRDFDLIAESDAVYYPTYETLAPAGLDESALSRGAYDDPFRNVPYAMFRVGISPARLDDHVEFGA